jgi:regulator of ribonuclease activity A
MLRRPYPPPSPALRERELEPRLQNFSKYNRPMKPTTDLCDAYESKLAEGSLRVLAPLFQSFGKRVMFSGRVKTLKTFEDNSLVKQAVESPGEGRVLVVDGAASLRCALLGGNLAKAAAQNGWAGVILNAPVRDADEIDTYDVGVRALATVPVRSQKRGLGEYDVTLNFAGATIKSGEWCYVDRDGILISDIELT